MSTLLKDNLEIHKFSIEGKRFAFIANSLDFFQMDEIVWDILDLYEKHSREEIIKKLENRYSINDIVSALDEVDDLQRDAEIISGEYDSVDSSPNVMLLQVSHACNLGCRYCYVQQVDYCKDKELMTREVGKQAVEFLARESKDEVVRITFFGGEPLLNFPVIRSIVAHAEEVAGDYGKKFVFRLSTNGTLFNDENLSFIARNNFDSIQISLDGPPEIHDRNRPFISGRRSCNTILRNVRKIIESPLGKDASRRITINAGYTGEQLNIYETFLFLAGIGPDRVSMSPYFLPEPHPLAVTAAHVRRLREEYRKIGMFYIELLTQNGNFCFKPYAARMRQLVNKEHLLRGCNAGLKSFAVAPNGDIYPCQLLDGKKEYKIGNVFEDIETSKQAMWRATPISMREKCRGCWARFLCGGGCRAYSILFSGGMGNTFDTVCELEKALTEEAVYLISELEDRRLMEHATRCLNTLRI